MDVARAYIGLGTNLGDRRANLETALAGLAELGTVVARSDILETEPWGYAHQPRFLNMVAALDTGLPATELHRGLQRIEQQMGRQRSVRYGPRLIDLDLLLYGEERIATETLTVPHPRMAERAFVMEPLRQIAPDVAARIQGRASERPDHNEDNPHADVPL